MKESTKLEVKLYFVADGVFGGPISLTTYKHLKPSQIVDAKIPLQLPPPVSHVYDLQNSRYLQLDKPYGDQDISDGDTLVATDFAGNLDALSLLADAFQWAKREPSIKENLLDKFLERLAPASRALVEEVPWVGKALAILIYGPKK